MNGLPKGAVIMWHGEASNIPDGWLICDGSNNTPDLRRRFIVGAEETTNRRTSDTKTNLSTSGDYDSGKEEGIDKVTLSKDQMPKHNHNVNLRKENSGRNVNGDNYSGDLLALSPQTYNQYVWIKSDDSKKSKSVYDRNGDTKVYKINDYIQQNDIGNNEAHENRPPYYALYFIMKVI